MCVFPLRIITREFYCVGNENQWGVSDPVCRNTSLLCKRGLWWRPLLPNFLISAFLPEIKGHLEVLREAVIWSAPLLEFLRCLPVSFQLFISVFSAAVLVLPSDSTSFIPSLLWFHPLIWVFLCPFYVAHNCIVIIRNHAKKAQIHKYKITSRCLKETHAKATGNNPFKQ